VLFDPTRPRAIADAVARLLDDEALRRRLQARGRERAARFTWSATAQGTLRAYRRAVAGGL
jgi:glycosyltransferase involved in cell wall biosynthesis